MYSEAHRRQYIKGRTSAGYLDRRFATDSTPP
jgi:hypothetical protein